MPELPDITVYVEHLKRRLSGQTLERVRITSPFLLRTYDPPVEEAQGKVVRDFRRMGKRIVFVLEQDLFLVLHLMIAGRLHWKLPDARIPAKVGLAAFDFRRGTLLLTEASTRKRASLHAVRGEEALRLHDPGGVEVEGSDPAAFRAALVRERRTVKRALTDPHLFSGIGNAYSDEILHRARLSPFRRTDQISDDEAARLHAAAGDVLREWTERLRREYAADFPEGVTAFRDGMAVHGRYRKPCPVCGAPIQRVRFSENEMFYCPGCQTEGKILADRSLSRLLRDEWPRRLEDLER